MIMRSRRKIVAYPTLIRLILITIVCAILATLTGCPKMRELKIPDRKENILLYDRYSLEISGGGYVGSDPYMALHLRTQFIDPRKDTTSFDTIPFIVYDSCCVEGLCIGGEDCYELERWGTKYYYYSNVTKKLEVMPYDVPDAMQIPYHCEYITLTIYSRLLDSADSTEIDREIITVPMKIDTGRRLSIGD